MSVASLLEESRSLLVDVERERNRLAFEVFELRAGRLAASILVPIVLFPGAAPVFTAIALTDPLGIDDRARSYEGLIGKLEDFVLDVFNRVEAKALSGDAAAALRLRDATARILGVVVTSSPVDELAADVGGTVDDALAELRALLLGIGTLVGIGLALYAANTLLRAFGRR